MADWHAVLQIRLKGIFQDPEGIAAWLFSFRGIQAVWMVEPEGTTRCKAVFPLRKTYYFPSCAYGGHKYAGSLGPRPDGGG